MQEGRVPTGGQNDTAGIWEATQRRAGDEGVMRRPKETGSVELRRREGVVEKTCGSPAPASERQKAQGSLRPQQTAPVKVQ